jgi:hypothetical protein
MSTRPNGSRRGNDDIPEGEEAEILWEGEERDEWVWIVYYDSVVGFEV